MLTIWARQEPHSHTPLSDVRACEAERLKWSSTILAVMTNGIWLYEVSK